MEGREALSQYKEWYKEKYGFGPTEKLIDMFCKINNIDIAREEVAKVEVEVCSTATVTSAETEPILKALPYSEANFRALETNYQNLLGEYEDMCAVTKMKDKENDVLIAKVHVLIPMLETVIRFLIEPFKEQLPSDTLEELANVERYLEGCKNEYSSCSKSA